MIGWIVLCFVIISSAFATAMYDVNPFISLFIMLLALIPGYFIFKLSLQSKRGTQRHERTTSRLKSTKDRGKVINFPEGGRTNYDIK
jgi:uncharacterized membrane protein